MFEHGRSADTFVGVLPHTLWGVLPEDERVICRKRTYVIPLNTTNDERIRSGGAQPFGHTPPEREFFSLVRPESAAAAGGAAAFADVAAAGRAHLGAAGEAERSVRGAALLGLD